MNDDIFIFFPTAVAVDSFGNVYVCDQQSDHNIQKFDSEGSFIKSWGSEGFAQGVDVASSGNVYVTDATNARVQKFDSEGSFIKSWGSFSESGTGEGKFFHPMGLAVDSSENVYVVDFRADLIQKFDPEGTFITQWSSEGCKRVDVGSTGDVYVTDGVNLGVRKFDSEGSFVKSWGKKGNQNGQFSFADGVAVDSSENVYVSDGLRHSRIQKFDSDGTFITTWGSGP
jgi:streptogramin lyase